MIDFHFKIEKILNLKKSKKFEKIWNVQNLKKIEKPVVNVAAGVAFFTVSFGVGIMAFVRGRDRRHDVTIDVVIGADFISGVDFTNALQFFLPPVQFTNLVRNANFR